MTAPRIALRGDLLDFVAAPARAERDSAAVRWRPDHWLLIEGTRIVGAQAGAPDVTWRRIDHAGKLILPGFIDTHVHSPQLDVIGSWGAQLLDWLETYTFPAEMRLADPQAAQQVSQFFLDALLAHGTTSAVVFPTVHKAVGRCAVRGRTAARHAADQRQGADGPPRAAGPERHVEGAEATASTLIDRWHGRAGSATH